MRVLKSNNQTIIQINLRVQIEKGIYTNEGLNYVLSNFLKKFNNLFSLVKKV